MNYAGVAISGKAGAGKDTFATALCDILALRGVWATRVGFADAVKSDVLELHGVTKDMPGGRDVLVEYSNLARSINPDVWIERLEERLGSLSPYGLFPVIADLRYSNEYEWAAREGYLLVRVDTMRMDRMVVLSRRGEDPDFVDSDHESETALDEQDFDVRFWNPHNSEAGWAFIHHVAVDVADRLDVTTERAA